MADYSSDHQDFLSALGLDPDDRVWLDAPRYIPGCAGSEGRYGDWISAHAEARAVQIPPDASGRDLFFTVSEIDGDRRTDEGVTRARAHFIDVDGSSDPAHVLKVFDLLPPTVRVRTSEDRDHYYWPLARSSPYDHATFTGVQKRLAAIAKEHGIPADDAVSNPARIMRLPGSLNRKRDPAWRVTWHSTGAGRTVDVSELIEAYELPGSAQDRAQPVLEVAEGIAPRESPLLTQAPLGASQHRLERYAESTRRLASLDIASAPTGARATTAFARAAHVAESMLAAGLDPSAAESELVEAATDAGLDEVEARGHVRRGLEQGVKSGPRPPKDRPSSPRLKIVSGPAGTEVVAEAAPGEPSSPDPGEKPQPPTDMELVVRVLDRYRSPDGERAIVFDQATLELYQYVDGVYRALPQECAEGLAVRTEPTLRDGRCIAVARMLRRSLRTAGHGAKPFFDGRPRGVLFRNGFLSELGILEPVSPRHRAVGMVPIEYDPDVSPETAISMLATRVGRDAAELIIAHFALAAYGLTEHRMAQCLWIHGPGGSGKSTIIELLGRSLYDGAIAELTRAQLCDADSKERTHLASPKACLVVVDEAGSTKSRPLTEEAKRLTAATERTRLGVKFKTALEVRPHWAFFFTSNFDPDLHEDTGFERRLVVIHAAQALSKRDMSATYVEDYWEVFARSIHVAAQRYLAACRERGSYTPIVPESIAAEARSAGVAESATLQWLAKLTPMDLPSRVSSWSELRQSLIRKMDAEDVRQDQRPAWARVARGNRLLAQAVRDIERVGQTVFGADWKIEHRSSGVRGVMEPPGGWSQLELVRTAAYAGASHDEEI